MTTINSFDDRTTSDILQLVRDYRAGKIGGSSGARSQTVEASKEIYFTNDSGEEIPAYACMQITGTREISGQNYLVVDKPNGTGDITRFLFNSSRPVATDDFGLAQSSTILRGYKNSGTITSGDRWGPTAGQWYLSKNGGAYSVVGADDVESNVFRFSIEPSRLFRFTLNASLASGTADADILEMDGSDTGVDADVLDPLGIFATLTTIGTAGLCIRQDGKFYVIQAACPE